MSILGGDAGAAASGDRRAAVNAARLAALVRRHRGPGERRPHAFGPGAALTGPAPGGDGAEAWVLVDDAPERALGPALLWAERHGAARLHVVADTGTGTLARQAALFAAPVPEIHRIDGTDLVPVDPSSVTHPPAVLAPAELVDLLMAAGLEVVVEGGLVRGEVNGLEVARIVTGRTSIGVPIDDLALEVGVGRADRELTAALHGELTPADQLGRVVAIVRQHRRPGAAPHPLNQLVPDRWLRASLCRAPGRLGLVSLRPAEGVRPRANLRDRDIAIATGSFPDGTPAVVACAVGVSLDLVPAAADARAFLEAGARLLLAVPERDDLAGNRRLAARLLDPAEVVPVRGGWQ